MARSRFVLSVIVLAGVFLAFGCASPVPAGGGKPAAVVPAAPQVGSAAAPQIASAPTGYAERTTSPVSPPPAPTVSAPASSAGAQPAPTVANAKEFLSSQQVGDLQVKLRITPFPPVGRNASTLEVTLADFAGQPVGDAQVSFDLTMPAMPMPTNRPTAQAVGDGRYTASARMLMPGEWWITVIIRHGGKEQRVTFKGAEVP